MCVSHKTIIFNISRDGYQRSHFMICDSEFSFVGLGKFGASSPILL